MSRRYVITGAGRGIGLAVSQKLIAQGDEVWGACRNPDGANDLADAGAAGVLRMDLGDAESIADFATELTSRVDSIDTLINMAGITANDLGGDRSKQNPLIADAHLVMEQIRINAVGPMLLIQALRPLLAKGSDPLVLNVTSQLGSMVVGAKMPFDLGYNGSKAVLNMLTVMAATADPEVAYVALHPGWVQSDMGGPYAEMTVDESATGIVELLGNLSADDTGRFLRWDGTEHPW